MGNSWKGGQVWCLVFFVRETRVYLKTSEEFLRARGWTHKIKTGYWLFEILKKVEEDQSKNSCRNPKMKGYVFIVTGGRDQDRAKVCKLWRREEGFHFMAFIFSGRLEKHGGEWRIIWVFLFSSSYPMAMCWPSPWHTPMKKALFKAPSWTLGLRFGFWA